ncbi:Aminopeptidase 2 mitochondrial, partial [Chytridiales sp. JEL 0842]
LFSFAVGDFEFIETTAKPKAPAEAKPITVRVFTLKGDVQKAGFGLEVAARTLEYFSEYFNEAYPLTKCDLIAVPDFAAGAMENWGLITFRTVYLLFDEKNSSSKLKQQIAYIIGHELAHQWFGNLATMQWWNDLWLNEGFATFVGWMAVDHLFPEWDIFVQFLIDDYASGLSLDSLRSSHPIDVDVFSPTEINEIFDAISYSKGASVIRMLNEFLGGDLFMNGVRTYLQEFKYKNSVTADLWRHLSKSSNRDVASLMHAWTKDMGFPLVEVTGETYNAEKKMMTVTLKQSRFLASGDLKPEEDKTTWWIPVSLITNETQTPTQHIVSMKEASISFPFTEGEGAYWKLNYKATGFYRVKYQDAQINRLKKVLQKNPEAIPTGDRVMLVSDAFSLTIAGLAPVTNALGVLEALEKEFNYIVLGEIDNRLSSLRSSRYKEAQFVRDSLDSLQRQIFSSKVSLIGWEKKTGEPHLDSLKRTLILNAAMQARDKTVEDELRAKFKRFVAGDESALPADLRSMAYQCVLRTATPETAAADYESVLNIYKNPATSQDQRLAALTALGAINDLTIVKEQVFNGLLLNPELVKPSDLLYPFRGLQLNPNGHEVREMTWVWIKANWGYLLEKLKGSLALLGHVVGATGSHIGFDRADEIEKWVAGAHITDDAEKAKWVDDMKTIKKKAEQTLESIRIRTQWVEKERANLASWAQTKKF